MSYPFGGPADVGLRLDEDAHRVVVGPCLLPDAVPEVPQGQSYVEERMRLRPTSTGILPHATVTVACSVCGYLDNADVDLVSPEL